MATEVRVPTLGESVSEATIGTWLKKVGDTVKVDEPLVELETDKVSIEVPSPVSGVLSEILAPDGETVEVNALLAQITEGKGEEAPAKAEKAPEKAEKADAVAQASDSAGAKSTGEAAEKDRQGDRPGRNQRKEDARLAIGAEDDDRKEHRRRRRVGLGQARPGAQRATCSMPSASPPRRPLTRRRRRRAPHRAATTRRARNG